MGREIETAAETDLFGKISVIGYSDRGINNRIQDASGIQSFEIKMVEIGFLPRKIVRIIGWFVWSIMATIRIVKIRPDVIQAHSLASLPAACIGKLFSNSFLIYDAHELETHRAGWSWSLSILARSLEAILIRMANHVIVVSNSIYDWYRDQYGVRPIDVIRNIPNVISYEPSVCSGELRTLRDELGVPKDDVLYVYLGAIDYGRGIGVILEAFSKLPRRYHFCALGYGRYTDLVKDFAREYPNIHFHDAVPGNILLQFIATCDIGLSLGEDVCLSYRYSLPNKLFECRHAGLPVLCSNLKEMANFIGEFGGGWVVEPNSQALTAFVKSVDRQEIRQVLSSARPVPTWQDDERKYIEILRKSIEA